MSNKDLSEPSLLCWVLLRFVLGFIFLWAFLDKVFGLGHATKPEHAWINGVSPTMGYLSRGTEGPFASVYETMAGNPIVDVLFMGGLLLLGLSLLLGIGLTVAGYAGSLLMLLLWSTVLPPANNPIFDEHIVYLLVLLGIARSQAGTLWGLGQWWSNTKLVKTYPILR